MSYLLFLDESGHDHKVAPYEVTGGVAIHVSKLWPLSRATGWRMMNDGGCAGLF